MQKIGRLLFAMLFSYTSYAQIGGQSTYQFLNLTASPRQAALGGKNITTYDYDPTGAIYNPALINPEMDNQLSLNYVNYLADVNYGTASYAYLIDRRTQVLHTGITYINYGTFDGYTELGDPTGEFTGGEAALSFGYAYNIPFSDFYVGANLKLISSKLEQYSSFGGAVDLGLTYVYEDWDLVVAGAVRNLGSQFTPYNDLYEKIPTEVILGISQQADNVPIRWHLTLENLQEWNIAFRNTNRDETDLSGNVQADDPGFFNNVLRHTIIGAELFPESGFNIRLGYNFRKSEELRIVDQRSFAGLSGGISIKFNKVRLSYTYARYSSAANSSFFGVNINLQ
ncbi:type IX secretion system protein PorQ [Mesonia sp. K7]|uniref:type IX secretion system protein PorQ n=1 Tax=Mesonia sp. K7 TaxID=2218606 RepID=UPI000DA7C815|nr:type IX secretion system protein PorQ [Mesonia sp. K7]PZD77864.1 penicillin-binding protein [Mesonia sp. K7]